jgi:hypothetical protein
MKYYDCLESRKKLTFLSSIREVTMRMASAVLTSLSLLAVGAAAQAQTPTAPTQTVRTVIAATKLPSVIDEPLHFRAFSITLAPGNQ